MKFQRRTTREQGAPRAVLISPSRACTGRGTDEKTQHLMHPKASRHQRKRKEAAQHQHHCLAVTTHAKPSNQRLVRTCCALRKACNADRLRSTMPPWLATLPSSAESAESAFSAAGLACAALSAADSVCARRCTPLRSSSCVKVCV
eukprot:888325-Pelagomonas_calceolata.AAC.5